MHSDPLEVQQSVRSYMKVFAALLVCTIITVAASQLHFVVPVAIAIALLIATVKGSMVAAVFMHLSHEKQAIYGALLLTFVFFVVLMVVPLLTMADRIGRYADVAPGVSPVVHRAVGRAHGVLRRVGRRPIPPGAPGGVRGGRGGLARRGRGAGRLRRRVPAEDEETVVKTRRLSC